MSAVRTNWSKVVRFEPARVESPVTEEQVQSLVSESSQAGLKIRCVGKGHSFNRLATTDGVLLDLAGCANILHTQSTVTVGPGVTLRRLLHELASRGRTLANVGTLADQTVIGALSTGNHGTGINFGPLSSQVTRLRVVTADGRVHEVDAVTDSQLFHSLVTSLGVMGVITSVTLATVPSFTLDVDHERETITTVISQLDAVARSADHVGFTWQPWNTHATIRRMSRINSAPERWSALHPWTTTIDEVRCGVASLASNLWSNAVPKISRIPLPTLPSLSRMSSVDAFCFRQPVKFIALEHALPLAAAPEALAEIGAVLKNAGQWSPYSVLVRFGSGSAAHLDPSFDQETAYINLTVPRSARFLELHRAIEKPLRTYGGRPHWGKAHTATSTDFQSIYPAWDTFGTHRDELDPGRTFSSRYIRELLGS